MFDYCNLLTYVFIDCILFKWKLCLFLDILIYIYIYIYICILSRMGAKIIRLFKNFKLFRIFSKKILIFQKNLGVPWSSIAYATVHAQQQWRERRGRSTFSLLMLIFFLIDIRLLDFHTVLTFQHKNYNWY